MSGAPALPGGQLPVHPRPAELSLISSSLKTVAPEDGDWRAATVRVAGIYGANGSGRSNVLSALWFVADAVRRSATAWVEKGELPHRAFALDETSAGEPSEFALDLVVDGVRYEYGFAATTHAVEREWLYSYPRNRRRKLFERTAKTAEEIEQDQELLANFIFSRELPGDSLTAARTVRPGVLFLSAAANVRHPFLGKLAREIASSMRFARYEDSDRADRLKEIKQSFGRDPEAMTALTELVVGAADVGIASVKATRELSDMYAVVPDLPERGHEIEKTDDAIFGDQRLWGVLRRVGPREDGERHRRQWLYATRQRKLVFGHVGRDGKAYDLSENDESSGTLAWLSLVVPAWNGFRHGYTLLVDELDASPHPRLAATLITMFRDPELNPHGAQLIFSTHDTNLLNDATGESLKSDEVWFTEKNNCGETELFSLADFPVRQSDNIEKRYLAGRYGAVPLIDIEVLRKIRRGEAGDVAAEAGSGSSASETPSTSVRSRSLPPASPIPSVWCGKP